MIVAVSVYLIVVEIEIARRKTPLEKNILFVIYQLKSLVVSPQKDPIVSDRVQCVVLAAPPP